ncbi:ribonuclease III [Roseomonas sp. NAR14]|uniref:Ribonuclease 3 n=1 Tax=Roseomonas acroporae TaxID=2937791 RepID=A0A9X1Y7M4_9PROT|nr:ribonuclease III [Roseomonas acroporae]MCK8783572.1 ribonuclease III [Roseomonas acroporae]
MGEFAERLGHRFADPELLARALTHRSAADPKRGQLDSNERLEFLGDRVLALLIAEWLTERFPAEREGDLGKRLGVLVAREALCRVAESIGLGAVLVVPPSEGRAGLRERANVLADAVEALLGALYLDGGLPAARALVRREWGRLIEADTAPPMSAKSRLQEWLLGRGLGLPAYRLVRMTGPSHQPVFVVAVTAAGREAEGVGDSKRAAEQAAAEAWLTAGPPAGPSAGQPPGGAA